MLLHGHGDVEAPLPETVRVLDEILTDFMQSVAFEAARAAHYSGRQKIKYEDFEFAFRKNPVFLGKVQEVFEKQKEIKKAREILRDGEDEIEGLVRLLSGRLGILNIIPFNTVDGSGFNRPSWERCEALARTLKARGILTKLRDSAGQDVDGGCGQLRARAEVLRQGGPRIAMPQRTAAATTAAPIQG